MADFDFVDVNNVAGVQPKDVPVQLNEPGGIAHKKQAAFGTVANESSGADSDSDLPFAMLLQHASLPTTLSVEKVQFYDSGSSQGASDSAKDETVASTGSHGLELSAGAKDDFVMIELKAPFVAHDEDLGRFYRECQLAPSLSMFEQPGNVHDMITSITDQLAHFEASAGEFNDFVKSLSEFD